MVLRVGVLALQGAFAEHLRVLNALPDVQAIAVRRAVSRDMVESERENG